MPGANRAVAAPPSGDRRQRLRAGALVLLVAALAGCARVPAGSSAAGADHDHGGAVHHHGGAAAQAPGVPAPAAPAVVREATWVDPGGNRFRIRVGFGPLAGGGGCTLEGTGGYVRAILLRVDSDPGNRPAAGPRLGARGGAVAFPHGDTGCSWDHADSDGHRFRPGEARTFTGLVQSVKDPARAVLVLTVGPPGSKRELARIPYRSIWQA